MIRTIYHPPITARLTYRLLQNNAETIRQLLPTFSVLALLLAMCNIEPEEQSKMNVAIYVVSISVLKSDQLLVPRSPLAPITYVKHVLLSGRLLSKISQPVRPRRSIAPVTSCFSHFSQCCFSFLSTTWPRESLSTAAQSHQSTIAHWGQIIAPTLRIVGPYGILFGAVLLQFSHVLGLLFIQIFHVLRKKKQTVVLQNGYGIHFCRSPSIAFRYSYAHCSYQSTCWLGRFGNT